MEVFELDPLTASRCVDSFLILRLAKELRVRKLGVKCEGPQDLA